MNIRQHLRRFMADSVSVEQRYLDEATSLVDLESRQRDIDRGRFRSR